MAEFSSDAVRVDLEEGIDLANQGDLDRMGVPVHPGPGAGCGGPIALSYRSFAREVLVADCAQHHASFCYDAST